LLTARDSAQPVSKEESYRTQIQHLTDLLAESEAVVLRLKEQESLLKEEIRKKDRDEKRSQRLANLEYLKNVVLRFLETGEKDKLLPVLTQLLELSPEEASRLKSSISTPTSTLSPISGLSFLSFGS
jgi:superfamily I DNA/RNA helicase